MFPWSSFIAINAWRNQGTSLRKTYILSIIIIEFSHISHTEETQELRRQINSLQDMNTSYTQQTLDLEEQLRRMKAKLSQVDVYRKKVQPPCYLYWCVFLSDSILLHFTIEEVSGKKG